MSAHVLTGYTAVVLPTGSEAIIKAGSIGVSVGTDGSIDSAKNFGFQLLGVMRIAISGIALIYLVMIGVRMII